MCKYVHTYPSTYVRINSTHVLYVFVCVDEPAIEPASLSAVFFLFLFLKLKITNNKCAYNYVCDCVCAWVLIRVCVCVCVCVCGFYIIIM